MSGDKLEAVLDRMMDVGKGLEDVVKFSKENGVYVEGLEASLEHFAAGLESLAEQVHRSKVAN
jgi:hypothetical protein